MNKILLFLSCLFSFCLAAAEYSVFLAPDATPAEENAAQELVNGLRRIFGSAPASNTFAISRKDPGKCLFWVGQSGEAAQALGMKDFSDLKPDEILLKTFPDKTILLGARPRGTIYAVYEFLERAYGVRFWTADVEHWPVHEKFFRPGIDHRYAPVFQRRYVYYDLARKSPFCVKLRTNRYPLVSPRWGGCEEIIGFVHTFGLFVPAKKHFEAHPEWFALLGGKRVSDGQPCLTNREFRKALIESVLAALRKKKDPRMISISQNDGGKTFCECAECTRFIREHGNESDLLWDTVNEVADAIAAEFPDVQVETDAYSFTLEPPKTIVPRKNVVVRFCSGLSDKTQAIDSPGNEKKYSIFKEWCKFGNPLAVWTYETDFYHFYMPNPNWQGLLRGPRFFADHGVIDIFQQGSYAGPIADLSDLRVWVLGKLQWNPYQDPGKLIEEFAKGFYGKAAPCILDYIDHMIVSSRKGTNGISAFDISDDDLLRARKILLDGEKIVADDPVLRQHLRVAAVPVNLDLLQRPGLWEKPVPALQGVDWRQLLSDQLKIMAEEKVTRLAEDPFTPDMLERNIVLRLAWEKGAPPVPGYPEGTRWKQVAATDCQRYGVYREVKDPDAANGKVVEVDCTHATWTSQFPQPPEGCWDVYVELQCLGKEQNPSGTAATFGCYDVKQKDCVLKGSAKAETILAPGYHIVKMGRLTADENQFLYCAPAINKTVEHLRISRYIFIEAERTSDGK